ncbi:hypothetical protein [Arthrobacter sp. TWP1-1]|uniref:hypothetical protein n=1 Tax=Arthrobacter sp. TWP1-1 TaxID=2804568 RepID=UPI003CF5B668
MLKNFLHLNERALSDYLSALEGDLGYLSLIEAPVCGAATVVTAALNVLRPESGRMPS